jgi:hypothetical protein
MTIITRIRITAVPLVLVGLLLAAGCGGPRGTVGTEVSSPQAGVGRVVADAYLYDAKLVRQGKPTSFRLELFCTDSMVALGGRGYLGKGALRGVMTSDSLHVYFPVSNEFLVDGINMLLSAKSCITDEHPFNALQLLRMPAGEVPHDSSITITVEKQGKKRQEFELTTSDCPWKLRLVYEPDEERWRIRELRFDNGAGVELTARLREGQRRVAIASSRFQVSWPNDATPLEP